MLYPQTKVLQRRRDVTSLLVRGISPGEIAEVLKLEPQTVYNDIRVIRSGKNDALFAFARDEIKSQLFLNAQHRARSLWRIVDDAEKEYVRVLALRELRLNDERIFDRLSDPKNRPKEEAEVPKEMMEQMEKMRERVEALQKRRLGLYKRLIQWLEDGDTEQVKEFLRIEDLISDKQSDN